jgi:hypothetical protein
MTQIVAISANTAAMNIEVLRTPRRISVKDQVQDVKADADKNAKRAENVSEPSALGSTVPAVTIGLELMTTGGRQPQQHVPVHQVEAAYRDLDD